jgi:shikimate dehydrogenase
MESLPASLELDFQPQLTGVFSSPARQNPTAPMVEAAFRHHGIYARYITCEVPPAALGDAVRGARAMGWMGFNCSIPHKTAVIQHLDRLASQPASLAPSTASSTATAC